jgi:hypothetical protein
MSSIASATFSGARLANIAISYSYRCARCCNLHTVQRHTHRTDPSEHVCTHALPLSTHEPEGAWLNWISQHPYFIVVHVRPVLQPAPSSHARTQTAWLRTAASQSHTRTDAPAAATCTQYKDTHRTDPSEHVCTHALPLSTHEHRRSVVKTGYRSIPISESYMCARCCSLRPAVTHEHKQHG